MITQEQVVELAEKYFSESPLEKRTIDSRLFILRSWFNNGYITMHRIMKRQPDILSNDMRDH